MKIVIATCGSRGDVQPVLALALELKARGHDVLLAAPPENESWVNSYGMVYAAFGSDIMAFLLSKPKATSLKAMTQFIQFIRKELDHQFEQLPRIVHGADLIIGAALVVSLPTIAEHLTIPYRFIAYTAQFLPSGRHPSPMTVGQKYPACINRLSWQTHFLFDRLYFQRVINRQRRQLGLPPTQCMWTNLLGGTDPIVACDSEIDPVPSDTAFPSIQVGYMHLKQKGQLSDTIKAFLKKGPPPIYFGFGSMPGQEQSKLRSMLLRAARDAGQRVVMLQLRQDRSRLSSPDDCCFINKEPHDQLFPHMAAIVHHGGAGTTATAARAGIPQIIVPHVLDQFHYAHRVYQCGLSPKPVLRTKLTRNTLADRINEITNNPKYRKQAQIVAEKINHTNSIAKIIKILESDPRVKKI
jgi:UDP:flavonoid glycosyltransferase YjiC (YdhE family)